MSDFDRLASALADRYALSHELGAGGMATVYGAEDLKHHRKVAVKVLKPELAAVLGSERFLQEIETTANLQHPHILALFDSGEADGFLYYVMPLIEGESLREKLDRDTQLGVEDAVRIASDVADALDYAHRHHVIHRDIKPENILLQDGRPVVADFGIALAVSAAAGGRMTETGLSLGTPHYMSPEQATAEKDLSNRSDIYSLGAVLYEMLTGDPPHTGSSAQQIIMKIVTDDARSVADLRKSVPGHVAGAVAKALEKLPADRFESAAEFSRALGDPGFVGSATASRAAGGASTTSDRGFRVAVATAGVLGILAAWGWMRGPSETPLTIERYAIALPGADSIGAMALSPDGSIMAWVAPGPDGAPYIWTKQRSEPDPKLLDGTRNASNVSFSPDGAWLTFVANQDVMMIIPASGGSTTHLADFAREGGFQTPVWFPDGTIVYVHQLIHLMSVSANGETEPQYLVSADSLPGSQEWTAAFLPVALPDGHTLLFTACDGNCANRAIWALDRRDGSVQVVREGAIGSGYVQTGHILYTPNGRDQFATAFDMSSLQTSGDDILVMENVGGFALSEAGDMIYQKRVEFSPPRMVWMARDGTGEPASWQGLLGFPRISPDGAFVAGGRGAGTAENIWLQASGDGNARALTFGEGSNYRPSWSPDGERVLFVATGRGLAEVRRDGTGGVQLIMPSETVNGGAWSPDGEWIVYRDGMGEADQNIMAWHPVDSTTVTISARSDANEHSPEVSPDGRWIAYVSDETGDWQVYVRPFPNVDESQWRVSTRGGTEPAWSRDGTELYFRRDGAMLAARVRASTTFAWDPPEVLFVDRSLGTYDWHRPYDVGVDGRFLLRQAAQQIGESEPFILVRNWILEFEELVGN